MPYFIFICFLLTGIISCKPEKNTDDNKQDAFQKKDMLRNMAEQIIIPNLSALQLSMNQLSLSLDSLVLQPTPERLENARQSWNTTFIDFLHCNAFNFGPGEKSIVGTFHENLGIWPVNVLRLEERISQSNTNFNDFERDTRGFQAMEYLLFGTDALLKLQDTVQGNKRKAYLIALRDHARTWIQDMNTGWSGYKETFISSDGKDVGSSTALLYNEFLKSYEAIKNFKIGLPAGNRAGQTQAEPEKVESYYSSKSVQHIRENFISVENIWRGKSRSGTDGLGFDDWLNTLQDGQNLKAQTEAQFAVVHAQNTTFQDSEVLSQLIQSDLPRVQNWYIEYQKCTRYIKSDLSSLIGIAITFSSSDGD